MLAEESERTGGGEVPEEEGEVSVEDEGSKTPEVTSGGGTKAGLGAKSGEISGLARAVRRWDGEGRESKGVGSEGSEGESVRG